jgi:hypothetical protein
MNRQIFRNSFTLFFAAFLTVASVSLSFGQGQPGDPSVTASVRSARKAGVSETALNRLMILAVDHRLEDDDVVRLVNFLQTVQTENLPTDAFMGKIEEGLAKKIPLNTISAVLAQRLEDYRFVRRVVAEKTGEQEISHQDLNRMVGSLDGGITREELARFILAAPRQDLSMLARATEILALLKQVQFNESLAQEILFTGLRKNSLTQSWDYLARVVATAKRRQISDDQIAEAAIHALEASQPLGDFMSSLGFTSRDLRRGPATGQPAERHQ